ncbi:hypothetical protein FPV67DRAFT_232338 [Lyophyllum atratum]|nr:hypothetical protein FPV67DRAFT_232338 [Lyophyllum atratum]
MLVDERSLLQGIGRAVLKNLAYVTTISLLYGGFTVVVALVTVRVLSEGRYFRFTKLQLGMSILSFMLATLYWGAFVGYFVRDMRWALMGLAEAKFSLETLHGTNREVFGWSGISIGTAKFLPVINDAIVIWRCRAIYSNQRAVPILPLMMYLAMLGTTSAYLAKTFRGSPSISTASTFPESDNLVLASLGLSFAINLLTTVFVLYKLGKYMTALENQQRGPVYRILIIVVLSGSGYSALQLTALVLQAVPILKGSLYEIVAGVISTALTLTTAMYASIIFLFLSRARSVSLAETYEKPGGRTGTPPFIIGSFRTHEVDYLKSPDISKELQDHGADDIEQAISVEEDPRIEVTRSALPEPPVPPPLLHPSIDFSALGLTEDRITNESMDSPMNVSSVAAGGTATTDTLPRPPRLQRMPKHSLQSYAWSSPNSCFFDHGQEPFYRAFLLWPPSLRASIKNSVIDIAFLSSMIEHFELRLSKVSGRGLLYMRELERAQASLRDHIFNKWKLHNHDTDGAADYWIHHAITVSFSLSMIGDVEVQQLIPSFRIIILFRQLNLTSGFNTTCGGIAPTDIT